MIEDKIYGDKPKIQYCKSSSGYVAIIPYDIVEHNNEYYSWLELYIDAGKFSYNGIASNLINCRYPSDKMQAIINNYLLDPTDVDALSEFNEMQEYRKEAKSIARQIMDNKDKGII